MKWLRAVAQHIRTSGINGCTSRVRNVLHEIVQIAHFGEVVLLLLAADMADSITILDFHAKHEALNAHSNYVEDPTEIIFNRELNRKEQRITFGNGQALKFLRRDPNSRGLRRSASTADVFEGKGRVVVDN